MIFFLLLTEEFPDYKAARIREKFLKSGRGRKWLNEWEACQPMADSNPPEADKSSRRYRHCFILPSHFSKPSPLLLYLLFFTELPCLQD